MIKTLRGTEIRVIETNDITQSEPRRLAPVTLVVEDDRGSFRLQDYLTAQEASELGAALSAMALKVEGPA